MARPSLRLLTWNLGRVHLGARLNRWLGLDSRAADGALPHVARVIARADVDVVAVQELRRPEQAERLAALLDGRFTAATPSADGCDRRVALLVRRSLEPAFEEVALGVRPAQAAALSGAPERRRWAIASLHLEPFDGAARRAQARALLAWAQTRAESALVLAGDLNLDVAHPASRREDDTATYGAIATQLHDLGAAAGPTALGGRRVDYVLGRGVHGRAEVLRGVRVPLGDHDPVRAELTPRDDSPSEKR